MTDKRVQLDSTHTLKVEAERRLVYSVVYAPNSVDAHGDYMESEDVEKMAHDFLSTGATRNVDVQHDNKCDRDCYIVESFIARAGDPMFERGAWVVGIYVGDDETWKAIKAGEITGLSLEAWVTRDPVGQ